MATNNKLEDISAFIEKEAEKQYPGSREGAEIKETIKLLEEFSSIEPDNFTLTAGEINAYLG